MPRPQSSGRSKYHSRNNDPFANIRRNKRVRAPKVRVIGPDGGQLGMMSSQEAYNMAQGVNLDLVEISPTATPPVCRIMDFGKYVYEQQKKDKESKSKSKGTSTKMKEVKFRPRVELHDFMTKLRRAEGFLSKGSKVKMTLSFRGREMAHKEVGFETIGRAISDLSHIATADSAPRLAGRNINAMLSPLPANKRKIKYNIKDEEEEVAEESE
jgi:translation initiation factor IF-3